MQWSDPKKIGIVQDASLNEKSGLVASLNQPGVLWCHEDGGNLAALYAIDAATGRMLKAFPLSYANQDTEDIARGPDGKLWLFVNKSRSLVRVDEPRLLSGGYVPNQRIWTCNAWPAKGCEAATIDPWNGDIYLFEKYAAGAGDTDRALWKIPNPATLNPQATVLSPQLVAQLKFPAPVAADPRPSFADVSPDGKLIMVGMQAGICLYERSAGQPFPAALLGPSTFLAPMGDGCGEAGCFTHDGRSIIHVGERPDKIMVRRDRTDPIPTVNRTAILDFKGLNQGQTYAVTAVAVAGNSSVTATATITT